MKLFKLVPILFLSIQQIFAQDCKTNTDLDVIPGKFLTAAQYPWPAVRAEYFKNMVSATDKAMAKQTLNQIEKEEAKNRTGFTLTGGNWENYYSTEGYGYYANTRLGKYSFQSALYEYFCNKGKATRNPEYSTVLRVYVNAVPVNTLDPFLRNPFGSSIGEYDFGLQYLDWKNHKPADVNAQLITLFTYLSCNNSSLAEAMNTGSHYFQDTPEKDIRPNNRSRYIYRYWFVKKKNLPVLLPVTRKEYLQSLLEYYEREKLYFPKLITELTSSHDKGIEHSYGGWEKDLADKITVVKKALSDNNETWLQEQAVINKSEDAAQTYKAGMKERTNYNRFWKFYNQEKNSEPLYKYNPEYFKISSQSPAKPQIITVAFRYVPVPSSLRILDNFTQHFDFDALQKLLN